MANYAAYAQRGTRAAQPLAANVAVGTLYGVTDEGNILERSTGAAWQAYSGVSTGASVHPGGRLTLTTATPFLVATATAQTTIYYTPAEGDQVPIYDGTNFNATTFAELSQATTDNTKSPAAVGNNSNYDLFVWSDSGTLRCTRGPAWTSDTGRGTGAGTTELVRTKGILLNTVAITNGPGASRGTYVGSVRSNGSAQIDMIFGGVGGTGGEGTILGLWNMYNRQMVTLTNFDNTDTWNYTTATIRLKNAGASTELNKIKFIVGLQGDGLLAINNALGGNSSVVNFAAGIGLNATNAFATGSSIGREAGISGGGARTLTAVYAAMAPLGFNYVAPLEVSDASGTTSWLGDAGGTTVVSSFVVQMMF